MSKDRTSGVDKLKPLVLREDVTVQSHVYHALRQALTGGHFRPGESISLRHTAAALGTSLTPVREALRRLESDGGLVVQGANRMLTVPMISADDLVELRDIRLQLEGMATELACERIGPQKMRVIRNACELMEKAVTSGDVDQYLENNWRFHSVIYQSAGRPLLVSLIESLWLRVGPVIRLATPSPGHLAHSMECHWEAVEAMHHGDGTAARRAIERDIGDAASDLASVLREQRPKEKRRR